MDLLIDATDDKCKNFCNNSSDLSNIMSDKDINRNIGYNFVISDKLLGHGSYGDVYLANDENNNKIAVKCCEIDKYGIPNMLEASIMASFIHPYLNRALRIHATDNNLYILQDVAKTDLSQHTRRDKGNYKPTLIELQSWCFSLSQAILALHTEKIIHADVKASNILLYEDNSIKLSDFTLATKKWTPDMQFNHNVCTCTHRPLECLLRKPWEESLDIWSLGCTFYEIAYGELLFPYQGSMEKNPKEKEAKIRLKQRTINVLLDWNDRGINPPLTNNPLIIPAYPITYIPFEICKEFNVFEYLTFNDLLAKMLVIDPIKRLTIQNVISHPFFTGMKVPFYISIKRQLNKLSLAEQTRVMRYMQKFSNEIIIQNLAFSIYSRINDLKNITEQLKTATCVWIASKIILGYPPDISLPIHQILSTEREICHNLAFRLY